MTAELTAGSKFRASFLEQYELDDAGDHVTLDALTHLADEIEVLEARLKEDGPIVQGSASQPIAHPALHALRQHRQSFERLLLRLKEEPATKETTSQKAARAGRTRWQKNGTQREQVR